MRYALVLVLVILSGCVTGDRFRSSITSGMQKDAVIRTLGKPDGYTSDGDFEALTYANRLISGWSYDRADYIVILKSGLVVQYGPGQVRQGNGPNTLILIPL